MSYAILLVALLTLLTTLESRRKNRMQLDELKAALKELTDEIAALRLSISNEIARVEDVIAKLKASSIDPAELEPITAQLLATVDTLKGGQAALDGEQVAPAAPVDPAPPAQAAGA